MSTRFEGIEDEKVYRTGQYFKPGKYRVKINAVKWVKASVGTKEFTVIETEVLQSSNPEIQVGGERSHVIDMSGPMGLPTVKAFVAAASGVNPGSGTINEEVVDYWVRTCGQSAVPSVAELVKSFSGICEFICSAVNPLEGEEMDLECIEVTKRDGDPFTKHNWLTRQVEAAAAN
jgi:hypothetical protein